MHFMDADTVDISILAAFHYNGTTKWRPFYAYDSDLVFPNLFLAVR